MVTIGRIAPEKNTLYALETLQNVTQEVELDIFGPIYSEEYWHKCQRTINQLPSNIVVNYKNIIKGKELDQNVLVKPDDTIIVP